MPVEAAATGVTVEALTGVTVAVLTQSLQVES